MEREVHCCALLVLCLALAVVRAQSPGEGSPAGERQGAAETTAGFEQIGGPLPKVLKEIGRPYLVVTDIEVPANRMVTIEAGVVLLFRNFTGLHVQGKLVAAGTRERPVVFTSEFDTAYNRSSTMVPNPFDWDGIYIHDDAIGTMLTYCTVAFSVYGIKSDTRFIRIEPALFRQNGKGNLSIENVEQTVGSAPYSYVLDVKDAVIDGVPVNLLRDPAAPRRNLLRYVGIAAALGGIGAGIYEAMQLDGSQTAYRALSSSEFANLRYGSGQQVEDARARRNRYRAYAAASLGVGVLGTVGLAWSFTF